MIRNVFNNNYHKIWKRKEKHSMKTKKILAVVMVMMLSLCMLAGCKSDPVAGKWSMTKAKVGDIEQDASALGMAMMLEFKDGKVNVHTKIGEDSQDATNEDGTYKVDGNTVSITDADGIAMTATLDGNTMTLTQESVTFTLEKDGGKAYEAAPTAGSDAETTPASTAESEAETTAAPTAGNDAETTAE